MSFVDMTICILPSHVNDLARDALQESGRLSDLQNVVHLDNQTKAEAKPAVPDGAPGSSVASRAGVVKVADMATVEDTTAPAEPAAMVEAVPAQAEPVPTDVEMAAEGDEAVAGDASLPADGMGADTASQEPAQHAPDGAPMEGVTLSS
jgi:hypothetical protein